MKDNSNLKEETQRINNELKEISKKINLLKINNRMFELFNPIAIIALMIAGLSFYFNFIYEKDELQVNFYSFSFQEDMVNAELAFINTGDKDVLVTDLSANISIDEAGSRRLYIYGSPPYSGGGSFEPILIPSKSVYLLSIANLLERNITTNPELTNKKDLLLDISNSKMSFDIEWTITTVGPKKGLQHYRTTWGILNYKDDEGGRTIRYSVHNPEKVR